MTLFASPRQKSFRINARKGPDSIWCQLEANPMPIKYCLWRQGLIASPKCRLLLSSISDELARELDRQSKMALSE